MNKILYSLEISRYRDMEKRNPMNDIALPRLSLKSVHHPISRFLSYSVMPILFSLLAGLFILTACEEETAAPKRDSPPSITPIEDQTVPAGSSLTVSITATDDPGQTPTLSYSPELPYATLTTNGNGTADLLFAPDRNVSSGTTITITITITATSDDLTDTEMFILTVTDPEDRPPSITSISPDPVSVAIGKITNVTVSASDPDPDDTPTLALVSSPTFVTIVNNGSGTATINIAPLDPKTSIHVGRHRITVKASSGDLSAEMNFTLTITDDDSDGDSILDSLDVDDDNDGLIEINSLDDLHNIRHNLAGTSYKTNAMDPGNTRGAPGSGLKGYELTRDLDFNDPTSYERNEVNTAWATGSGWLPIGDNSTDNNSTRFTGILEGNGHKITNLMISRDIVNIGLFGYIGTIGQIRNLSLENGVADYTGNSGVKRYIGLLAGQSEGTNVAVHTSGIADGGNGKKDNVGGLVGFNTGTITNCYATGNANGGDGTDDNVGGLVGFNTGTITACYATGMADGGNGDTDNVGGLVGENTGPITACYATGMADGGEGFEDIVGGLVGFNSFGPITACYATDRANGGNGDTDNVGGLVGENTGPITACYATGMADGGDGNNDNVGGLVGFNYHNRSMITASYATGNADGGDGDFDNVGGLVGFNRRTITASYATGNADGGDGNNDYVGGLVGFHGDGSRSMITASYATGNADGGDGSDDRVGGLVGFNQGTITASYGFGTVTGEEIGVNRSSDASSDTTVSSASALTEMNSSTTEANRWIARVWDFGTDSQVPVLKWITGYNSSGATEEAKYPCDEALLPDGQSCENIIPGQGR